MLEEIDVRVNEIRAVLLRIIPTAGQQRSEEAALGYQCLPNGDEVALAHLEGYLPLRGRSGESCDDVLSDMFNLWRDFGSFLLLIKLLQVTRFEACLVRI